MLKIIVLLAVVTSWVALFPQHAHGKYCSYAQLRYESRAVYRTVYSSEKYTEGCGTWGWSSCSRYRSRSRSERYKYEQGTYYRTGYKCCPGWEGTSCEIPPCPSGCYGSCVRETGLCNSCDTGFRGDRCDRSCPANCYSSCSQSDGSCSRCKRGYYGNKCAYSCSSRCSSSCSQSDGRCSGCKSGYYGNKCSYSCSSRCSSSCSQSDGRCSSCKSGYYGNTCSSSCSKNCQSSSCSRSDGRCSGCKTGYYGNKCSSRCPAECDGPCIQGTGHCISCKAGFWGNTCDKPCPINCLGEQCTKSDGSCPAGCKAGYYGSNCSMTCPISCNGTCAQGTGQCDQCIEGLGGENCTLSCPMNCVNGRCSNSDGSCSDGCKEEYYGSNCSLMCPARCGMCDQETGQCDTCLEGFWGDACGKSCPNSCISHGCTKSDGSCPGGCVDGYFGNNCSLTCPGCNGTCVQETGHCDSCIESFWGEGCGTSCPRSCFSGECIKSDGTCPSGCVDGYYGSNCSLTCSAGCVKCDQEIGQCESCQDGLWGDNCTLSCSETCANWRCSQSNGSCSDGCVDGFYELACNFSCPGCLRKCNAAGLCIGGCKPGWLGDTCSERDIKVTSISPTIGILAGGARLTITGQYFPPTIVLLSYGGYEATSEKPCSQTTCSVLTPNGSLVDAGKKLPISVIFHKEITTTFTFTYKPNPEVKNIHPLETLAAGGTTLTVTGEGFDALDAPELIVHMVHIIEDQDVETEYIFFSPCSVNSTDALNCPTPKFDIPEQFLRGPEEDAPPTNDENDESDFQLSIEGESLEFYLGLRLDGDETYKYLPDSLPEYSIIQVFVTEPEFDVFPATKHVSSQERLQIKGRRLTEGLTITDYTVRVGSGLCDVVDLTASELLCEIPVEETLVEASEHSVFVHPGINISPHFIGKIIYKSSQTINTALIAGVCAGVGLFILCGLFGGLGWYCRRKTANSQQQQQQPDVPLQQVQQEQQQQPQQLDTE